MIFVGKNYTFFYMSKLSLISQLASWCYILFQILNQDLVLIRYQKTNFNPFKTLPIFTFVLAKEPKVVTTWGINSITAEGYIQIKNPTLILAACSNYRQY